MSIKGFAKAEWNYLYTGGGQDKQEHADEFLCRKCREWIPNCAESKLDGVCENCYIEFYDEREYVLIYNEPTERRESPNPKYVIDLDKIRKEMETKNRLRKGEPR